MSDLAYTLFALFGLAVLAVLCYRAGYMHGRSDGLRHRPQAIRTGAVTSHITKPIKHFDRYPEPTSLVEARRIRDGASNK